MSANNTNTPLWRELNVKRTQGEWASEAAMSSDFNFIRYITTEKGIIAQVRDRKELDQSENLANAQYTALSVNNLHILAEALENFIGCFDNPIMRRRGLNDFQEEAINIAKEALKGIS